MRRTLLGLVIFGAGVAGFMGAGLITVPILVGVSLVVSILSKVLELTKLPPHADESAVHLPFLFSEVIIITTVIASFFVALAFLLGRGISLLF